MADYNGRPDPFLDEFDDRSQFLAPQPDFARQRLPRSPPPPPQLRETPPQARSTGINARAQYDAAAGDSDLSPRSAHDDPDRRVPFLRNTPAREPHETRGDAHPRAVAGAFEFPQRDSGGSFRPPNAPWAPDSRSSSPAPFLGPYDRSRASSSAAGPFRGGHDRSGSASPLPYYPPSVSSRASLPGYGPRAQRIFHSALLTAPVEKPWLKARDLWATLSWWATLFLVLCGLGVSVAIIILGLRSVPSVGKLCLVFEDDFSASAIDTTKWEFDVESGGFGNGEFSWTTNSPSNAFVQDGNLFIVPTLTSGFTPAQIFDGVAPTQIPGCTAPGDGGNYTSDKTTGPSGSNPIAACTIQSSASAGKVVNPVQSARLTTRTSASITYGRVEVRARMPTGDWMWPAIWMLPVNPAYGAWPLSGEIDLVESRGNRDTYPAQGVDYISSALNWGPDVALNGVARTRGFFQQKHAQYNAGYHTFVLEWTKDFLWVYLDRRTQRIIDLRFAKESFFSRGKFPMTVENAAGTGVSLLQNPWRGRGNAAPFDQPFYLVLNVAVGGTNGYFPDNVGGKPWIDQNPGAMRDFALANATWGKTWPTSPTARGMAVDYVKMWRQC